MSILNDFATGLVDELLGEMADRFFGSRKRLDELIEQFANLAHDLRKVQEEAVRQGSGLLALVPESGHERLRALLASEGQPIPPVPEPELVPLESMPRALTRGGRFAKAVLTQYAAYRSAADAYMNGVVTPHPQDPRRKVVSLHFHQLFQFAQRVNQAIEKMNEEMPASCVIRYAGGFSDPGMEERERIAGAHCPYPGCQGETDLDREFAYHTIDFESYGLTKIPDLPEPGDVATAIKKLCSELMRTEKAAIDETMTALAAISME